MFTRVLLTRSNHFPFCTVQMNQSKIYIFIAALNSSDTLYEMVKSKDAISVKDARRWTRLIILAVNDLHKAGIAHRNLKLNSIMFDLKGMLKLTGFCHSVLFYSPTTKKALRQNQEKRIRTNNFLPPEAILEPNYMPDKADIWSVGVLIVTMATKRYPFSCLDTNIKYSNQWREFMKKHSMNTFTRGLCNATFTIEPSKRPQAFELLRNEYFTVSEKRLEVTNRKGEKNGVRHSSRVGEMSIIQMAAAADSETDAAGAAAEADLEAGDKEEYEKGEEYTPNEYQDAGEVGVADKDADTETDTDEEEDDKSKAKKTGSVASTSPKNSAAKKDEETTDTTTEESPSESTPSCTKNKEDKTDKSNRSKQTTKDSKPAEVEESDESALSSD